MRLVLNQNTVHGSDKSTRYKGRLQGKVYICLCRKTDPPKQKIINNGQTGITPYLSYRKHITALQLWTLGFLRSEADQFLI